MAKPDQTKMTLLKRYSEKHSFGEIPELIKELIKMAPEGKLPKSWIDAVYKGYGVQAAERAAIHKDLMAIHKAEKNLEAVAEKSRLAVSAKADELLTRGQVDVEKIDARKEAAKELKRVDVEGRKELMAARSAQKLQDIGAEADLKAKLEHQRVLRATGAVEMQAAALQTELKKGKPTKALGEQIDNFPVDDPQGRGRAEKAKMQTQYNLLKGRINENLRIQIENMGFTEEQVLKLREKAYETGRVHLLESKAGKKVYDPLITENKNQRLIMEGLEAKGIIPRGKEFIRRGGILPRVPVPVPEPGAMAALAAEGTGGTAGAVSKLASRVTKAPLTGGAKMAGGAGLAMVLLPLLSRILGGKKQEQQMPLAMQIQMAQMMAKMKQDEQLTQSLVSSRGASANKDMAQAELLRLKAMMAGGGGAGVLV